MSAQPQRKPADGPGAVELIEEAMHLLRGAPAATLLVYYAGTVPFALALLFFWAHTTWFTPSVGVVAGTCLLLVGFFAAMKAAHAEFCARLLAQRLGAATPPLTWRRFAQRASRQLRWQAPGLFLLPAAAVMSIPFGWVFAYFQNLTVRGESEDAPATARAQALLWPAQNHLGLLIISALVLCAAVNLGAAFWLVPWLANRLLGIENVFGLAGGWFFNSTFLASVAVLTWLAVDPLVKAFYTLRIFHGRARRTGEDLRVELRSARVHSRVIRLAAAGLFWATLFPASPDLRAAAGTAAPPAVNAAQLDDAIDRTLASRDFQWRLRPAPVVEKEKQREGFLDGFFRETAGIIREGLRGLRAIVDWFLDLFPSHRNAGAKKAAGGVPAFLGNLLIAVIVAAVILIVVGLVLIWKRSRQLAPAVVRAQAAAMVTPDLQDENTQAAQLPADGWLALAREKMALGEWRLALRALYLATLAQLAAEGLVSLTKFKTNLDYERELRRRALSRQEIVSRFAQRRRGFEAAWYGRAQPVESDARAWLAELETPALP
jgi:hypothetical protein